MMRIVLTIAAAAAITMGVASQASASDITWSKAVDETGRPTDVVTGGAFFAAVTAGGSTTVNGVKFVGQTQSKTAGLILFGSAPIKVEARRRRNGIRVIGCWCLEGPIPKRPAR